METEKSSALRWIIVGVVAFISLIVLLSSFTSVTTGSIGVVTRGGQVERTIGAGYHLVSPIDSVNSMDLQTQKEQADATAASADQQSVFTTVAVNYRVDETHAIDLFTNVGPDYKSKVVDPAIQEVVKAVSARYTAQELLSKRPQVSDEIKQGLTERLTAYHILISDVSVVNFKYSDVYETAIEAKVTAEQNAQAAKNKLEQANYEAQAIKITSEAANNEKYIQLQQLEVQKEAVKKWNGQLPTQMIPGSALPFLNLK